MNSFLRIRLAAALVVACPALAGAAPAETSEEARLGIALRTELAADWEANYFAARVDLDGDGQPEWVVLVAGPMACGTGGCPLFVLADSAGGLRVVSRISIVQTPVRLSPRSTHGWRNLIVAVRGGGAARGNAELAFDGRRYAANPTVPPAMPAPSLEGSEILIDDFKSFRDGKPVPPRPGVLPVTATVLGEEFRTRDADELRYLVARALAGRYELQHGIAATPAEKATYAKHVQALRTRDREEARAQRDELQKKLAAGGLAQAERERAAADLDRAMRHLEILDGMETEAARNPEETRAARDMFAGAFILQWKLNRALYRRYGGRIVYQQGGPEPLDAWRLFLEEGKRRGDFAIRDAALEAAFWRYYTNDAPHTFYPAGSREHREAFDVAPWERAPAATR